MNKPEELATVIARISPAELDALDVIAARFRVSRAWLLREAVQQFVEAKSEPSLAVLRPQHPERAAHG